MKDALYLATDTPFEQNHILRLDRTGRVCNVADLASSSIFGCQTANALFFSTMVEPSPANPTREVHLAGSADAILPDGENATNYLAATTIATRQDDQVTTLWEVDPKSESQAPAESRTRESRNS